MAAIVALSALVVAAGLLGSCRWQAVEREVLSNTQAAPATGRFVVADDVALFIQESGPANGQVVLLVHGTGAWSEIWRPTMAALAETGFRAVAVDLPPFGFSERPDTARYTRSDQAKRLAALIDALTPDEIILLGHSFGCGPVAETALRVPDKIQALVLVDAALGLDGPVTDKSLVHSLLRKVLNIAPLRNTLIAATATNPRLTKTLLRSLIYQTEAATDTRIAMLQQPLFRKGSTAALGDWVVYFVGGSENGKSTDPAAYRALNMPVRLLWGDRDTITPPIQGHQLQTIIPDAELIMLSGVGHIPQIEDTEQFNRALLSVLNQYR